MSYGKLIIVRGPSGAGKTTLAKTYSDYINVEADMYHMDAGEYLYHTQNIKAAHEWCRTTVQVFLDAGKNVIVSNTFTRLWEIKPYLEMSTDVSVIRCIGEFQNAHNVPDNVVADMRERMEDFEGEVVFTPPHT